MSESAPRSASGATFKRNATKSGARRRGQPRRPPRPVPLRRIAPRPSSGPGDSETSPAGAFTESGNGELRGQFYSRQLDASLSELSQEAGALRSTDRSAYPMPRYHSRSHDQSSEGVTIFTTVTYYLHYFTTAVVTSYLHYFNRLSVVYNVVYNCSQVMNALRTAPKAYWSSTGAETSPSSGTCTSNRENALSMGPGEVHHSPRP